MGIIVTISSGWNQDFFFWKMKHVKPSAMSVSQVMTWENAVCSPYYWVLAKKIKLTEDLLINTLVEPPLPALYPPINPSFTQPPEMAPQIKFHHVPPILQFYCLTLKSYIILQAFASSHLLISSVRTSEIEYSSVVSKLLNSLPPFPFSLPACNPHSTLPQPFSLLGYLTHSYLSIKTIQRLPSLTLTFLFTWAGGGTSYVTLEFLSWHSHFT